MKKQPELTAHTRQKLVDAYFALRQAGKNPTVGAISQTSGYNRCTFYRYFTDTEQLLTQVEEEICEAFRQALDSHGILSPDTIHGMAGVYQNYGATLSVLLGKHGDPRFICRMKEMMAPIVRQLIAPLCHSDTELHLRVEMLLSAVLGAVTKWYELGCPIPETELGELVQKTLGISFLQEAFSQ